MAVRAICHYIVMTDEIAEEWKRHESGFARQWRVSMLARRKVHRSEAVPDSSLRRRIEELMSTDRSEFAVWKDACLVEAALDTDRVVVSLDDTVRVLLTLACEGVRELRAVAWVNPSKPDENAIPWLEQGARSEETRCLGWTKEGNRS